MIGSSLLFLLGIGLLFAGTEAVLRRVPKLAAWLRVSPLVVTVLLVDVMTSLPEFCVSLLAALRGQPAAATTLARLREAALADAEGRALGELERGLNLDALQTR